MIGILKSREYYRRLGSGPLSNQLYPIGRLFWAPSLFLLDKNRSHVVRSTYNESRAAYEYSVARTNLRNVFQGAQQPNSDLGLRSDERALIVGAKKRPVILVSRPVRTWADSNRRLEDCFLAAPVYSFAGDETKRSFSSEFIERIKGYVYPQFFYLPASESDQVKESFVRLDRIQAVDRDLLEQMSAMLSDDARDLLTYWIRVYMGENLEDVDDVLFRYRKQAIESLESQGFMGGGPR